MASRYTLLKAILAVEALLFVAGLPAWSRLAGASAATQAYLLFLGVFSALAVFTLHSGKPAGRIWAWAAAVTNLPVFPGLTPVGLLLAGLLLALDLKPKLRPAWPSIGSFWWASLAGLAFCWAGASNVHRFAQVTNMPTTPALLLFGGLWLAVPLAVFVHQAGHWLAGRNVDLHGIRAWSGWADPQPAALSGDRLRRRLLLWTLGGPLASLTLGALLLFLFIASPGSYWAGLGELSGLAATFSLSVFLFSIWPWHMGGYRSDGAQLLTILRHGTEYRRDRALALAAGDWMNGVAPRNWNREHLRAAASRADASRQHATACALNYLYCLDGDFDSSARYWIGRLASEFAEDRGAVPVRWKLEIVYYLAAHDASGRVGDAAGWRRSAGHGQGAPYPVRLRSDAALALSRGRAEEAAELIASAVQALTLISHRGFWELELELLNRLRERVDPSLFSPEVPPPFDRSPRGSLQWRLVGP
jgi:hypothetical protein